MNYFKYFKQTQKPTEADSCGLPIGKHRVYLSGRYAHTSLCTDSHTEISRRWWDVAKEFFSNHLQNSSDEPFPFTNHGHTLINN